MKTYNLTTKTHGTVELPANKIMCNETPVLPGDKHPHNMRLWLFGHEFGALCAIWASSEQDALDSAVDLDLMDSMRVDSETLKNSTESELEGFIYLGNASEAFYQEYLWSDEVVFDKQRDFEMLIRFARCADNNTLDY